MRKVLHIVFVPCLIFLVWALVSKYELVNGFLLPSPKKVFDAFIELLKNGELFEHIGASAGRSVGGFVIAFFIAIPTAYLFYHRPKVETSFRLVLESLRFIPPLSLIPLLILWLGIGEATKVAIVILASFFPIYLNVLGGFRQIDKSYSELSYILRLNRFEKFKHIELPASLPNILTGLRLGFGYSWRALVGAELVAASSGLGYLISEAGEMSRTDRVFVGILCIAVLGIIGDQIFLLITNKFTPWRRK